MTESIRIPLLSLVSLLLVFMVNLQASQPNIIVIISDDAGYADFSFMDEVNSELSGSPFSGEIPTPNLDQLRSKGTLFTNAYTGMVCSPSRAAISTGNYQNKLGYEFNIANATSANSRDGHYPRTALCFEHMKSLGYRTGAFGKWHLGSGADPNPAIDDFGNRTERQGVDEFWGLWRGARNYEIGTETDSTKVFRSTILNADGSISESVLENSPPWHGMHNSYAFTDAAIDFIQRNHSQAEPLFMYLAYTAPHTPLQESPDIDDPSISHLSGNRKAFASLQVSMDKAIGSLMEALEDPNNDGDASDSIRN